tara:strand:- start:2239 stop:3162 length:924 start_codon:yes stop_codon:yes gene_type:complete
MSDVNSGESVASETDNFVVVNSDAPVAPVEESTQVEESDAKDSEGTSELETTDENEAEEDGTTGEGDASEQDKGVQQEADKPKKSRAQKRIDKITREREDERRKSERLQRQVDELTKGDSKSEGAPKESEYETYDDYLTALDKYDGENDDKADAKSEKPSESEDQSALTDSQLTAQAILREKIGDGIDKYENFEEVALSEDVAITAEMVEALAECDDPLKVMYHLGNNKDIAAGIAGKTPIQQAREIAKLDLTVKVTPPKPTKTTTAADPISPVHGSDSQQKSVGDMSFKEYEEHMNKAEQARRSHG